jgi:hypothetical protein
MTTWAMREEVVFTCMVMSVIAERSMKCSDRSLLWRKNCTRIVSTTPPLDKLRFDTDGTHLLW